MSLSKDVTDGNIVISSRVRLARNLKKYPFYKFITDEQSFNMIKEVKNSIFNERFNTEKIFQNIDFEKLPYIEQYNMLENNLVSINFIKSQKPKHLILAKDENINIMINEEDHIRIQAVNIGYNIEKSLKQTNRIDDLLEESLDFAFDDNLGYLTSCITNVGTGIRASFMLHIPMLEKCGYINSISRSIARFGLVLRGTHGEGTEAYGSIYQISNQVTLGKTELEIIDDLKNITLQIVEREEALQKSIIDKNNIDVIDSIFRSYGILENCKKISLKDAMQHLSNIWIGFDMNIMENKKLPKLDIYNIMVNIQTANIIKNFNIEDKENIDIYRAKYINNILR